MKSELLKKAHREAKESKRNNYSWVAGKTYAQILGVCMRNQYGRIEKNYILSIPYEKTKAREKAKSLGAKWDADAKVWRVTTTREKLNFKNLEEFIITQPKVKTTTNQNQVEKSTWLVNDKKITNNLGWAEMQAQYGFTDFE